MIGSRWEELSERLAEALESPDPAARIATSGDPDLVELFAWHQRAGELPRGGPPAAGRIPGSADESPGVIA